MIIAKGEYIFIRFVNGVCLNAIVESWSDNKSWVKLPGEEKEDLLIYKTEDNVLFVRFLKKEKLPEEQKKIYTQVKDDFETLKESPKTDESLKTMAQLRDKMNQIEKEEILKKTHSFTGSGVREVTYGIPRIIPVASAPEHPAQEASRESFDIGASLQELFSKEDNID